MKTMDNNIINMEKVAKLYQPAKDSKKKTARTVSLVNVQSLADIFKDIKTLSKFILKAEEFDESQYPTGQELYQTIQRCLLQADENGKYDTTITIAHDFLGIKNDDRSMNELATLPQFKNALPCDDYYSEKVIGVMRFSFGNKTNQKDFEKMRVYPFVANDNNDDGYVIVYNGDKIRRKYGYLAQHYTGNYGSTHYIIVSWQRLKVLDYLLQATNNEKMRALLRIVFLSYFHNKVESNVFYLKWYIDEVFKKEVATLGKDKTYQAMQQLFNKWIASFDSISLMINYQNVIAKQIRALPNMTKKNINQETAKMMHTTSLKDYFSYIELDNQVDLEKYEIFERDLHQFMPNNMPALHHYVPQLRLRRIANYRALGMYYGINHTIVLDFRGYDRNGVRSFVHEYGHALDYDASDDATSMNNYSMQDDFLSIVCGYRQYIRTNGKGLTSRKLKYYSTATEIFARSFEIYQKFVKKIDAFVEEKSIYQNRLEYKYLYEHIDEVQAYFDKLLQNYQNIKPKCHKHLDHHAFSSETSKTEETVAINGYQEMTLF